MKQKLFTLLTLLVCVCTGAWADSEWVMKDWSTGHTGLTYWASGASADIPSTSTDKNTPAWSDESDYNTYTGTGGSSNFQLDSKTSTWKSEHPNRVWSFDVNANDVIKVYFMGGGSGNRSMYVSYNASTTNRDTETAFASATADGYTPTILTGTATKAGTVYLWCDNNVRVYAIKLTTSAPVVKYDVTYKANGSGEADVVNNVSKVDDNMFTYAGHAFAGWNTAANGSGNSYAAGAEVTSNLTLYAQWVNSATLFSMTNITGIVNSTEQASIGTVTATISDRSSVEVFNNKGNADGLLYNNNAINLNGSGSNYIHITFPSPLQVGDVITATFLGGDDSWKLSKTASDPASKTNSYTIAGNDALLGATELYIFKNTSAQVTAITIEGQGEIPNLTITSSKTPEVAIGTESTIKYTTSSSGNTTFACSDESVATVSNDGVITGVGAGTATITLTQAADETYRAGFAKVTVTVPETAMFKIKINGSTSTSVTGTIDVATAVTADVNVSSNRKMDKGKYAGFTLNGDYSLKTGDIIEVNVTAQGQGGNFIFYDSKEDNPTELYRANLTTPYDPKTYRFVIPETMNGAKKVYLRRGGDNSGINEGFNPTLGYIAVYRPESELTLSSTTGFNYGFGGFCAPANFTVTNGAAYKASLDGNAITLTKLDGVVPANTGVIIVGEKNATATINYTEDDATEVTDNILKGTTARIHTSSLKGDADKLLTLQKSTSKFIEYTGEYFPANRAYIAINNTTGSKAMIFDIKFADVTSVKNVEAVTSANEAKAVKKAIVNGRLVILTEKGYVNALGQIVK